MPNDDARGGIGGAANEVGGEFRASFAAWIAAHALAGRRVEGLDLPPGDDTPTGRILLEADTSVDDLTAEFGRGTSVLVQAKSSLELSRAADSRFASTAAQFARQVRAPGFDPSRTRLVIAVASATAPLRALQSGLTRRRQPLAARGTAAQAKALGDLCAHLGALSAAERDAALDAAAVLLPALTPPDAPARDAAMAWLEAHVVDSGWGEAAWLALESAARRAAARRFGFDVDGWLDALRRARVPLRADVSGPTGPRRQATHLALQRYRNGLVTRGTRVSVRALDAAVPDLAVTPSTDDVRATLEGDTDEHAVALSWLARRARRVLLLGAPGIGKTTAPGRLAAELATAEGAAAALGDRSVDADDRPLYREPAPVPLVVFVSVPLFADALRVGGNALETLVDVGLRDAPDQDRPFLRAEALAQCRTHGRALLLLDGLDECRARRHAVVAAIARAVDELHADAEVMLATRDLAYADGAALGFHTATLEPPRDLRRSLRTLAEHFAAGLTDRTPSEREQWADTVVDGVTSWTGGEGVERTPLAAIGRVVLAARRGLDALRAGRAAVRSALVDWIAARWEIDERRRGDVIVSAQLTAAESHDFVVQAFDVIAFALDACGGEGTGSGGAPADAVETAVARWAEADWRLSGPRARAAARGAVAFWDEAGVFVAGGPDAVVRARLAPLQELGAARWLARHATAPERASWIGARLADGDRPEVLALLGELHPGTARALVEHARVAGDRRIGLLAARVLAAPESAGPARHALVIGTADALAPHLAVGGAPGWEVVRALLALPVPPAQAVPLLDVVQQRYLPARAALAHAVAALRWTPVTADLAGATAVLVAGPPPAWPRVPAEKHDARTLILAAAEPLYYDLAVELADRATAEQPAVVDALLNVRDLSMAAVEAVHTTLRRRGWGEQVAAAYTRMFAETEAPARALLAHSAEEQRRFFAWVADLAAPAATYGQRRHLDEIAAYQATAVPGDTPSDAALSGFLLHPALAHDALRCAAVLGGFDARVLAAQAATLAAEGGRSMWQLSFAATPRELRHWPDGDERAPADGLLAVVVGLFTGTAWTAEIARRALAFCPDRLKAARLVRPLIPTIADYRARWLAAATLLYLDEDPVALARRWTGAGDPVLARAGAVAIAHWFADGLVDASALRDALLAPDDATRDAVRAVVARVPLSPEVAALVVESDDLPHGTWACLHCRHVNASWQRRSCAECNRVP